jgi:hypothetical protein
MRKFTRYLPITYLLKPLELGVVFIVALHVPRLGSQRSNLLVQALQLLIKAGHIKTRNEV